MGRKLIIGLMAVSFLVGACGYGKVTRGPNRALFGEDLKPNQAECWWIGFGPTCPKVEK